MIAIDRKTGKTSLEAVYAGGDIATGEATVISAMGSAKIAARSIHNHLSGLQKKDAMLKCLPSKTAT
jgi:glutamate synthase (NADPH/NADH) small chain